MLYCVGSLIGIIISCDLDVDNGFIGDKIIRERLGYFAEKIWKAFWYLYRRSLKHGSPLSHWFVISTYGRIGYIFLLLIVAPHVGFYYVIQPTWDLVYVLNWYWERVTEQREIIFGLIASDCIHYTLDIFTVEHKVSSTKNI